MNYACKACAWRGPRPSWTDNSPLEVAEDAKRMQSALPLCPECNAECVPMMRVLNAPDGCPRYIRLDALNEEWAQNNHRQSLARLDECGGLSPTEAAAIIERRP